MGIVAKFRKTTPRQRQLLVLLFVAGWVSFAVLQIKPVPHYVNSKKTSDVGLQSPYGDNQSPYGDLNQSPYGGGTYDVNVVQEPETTPDQATRAIVYATPAILFGSILFWWFGGSRKESKQREVEPSKQIPSVAPAPIREPISSVSQASMSVAESLPVVSDVTKKKQEHEDTGRSYRWGRFQGGLLVFGMPFFTLIFFVTAETPGQHTRAIGSLIFCALAIPMGIGILGKRRYGLILVYVTLGLVCVVTLGGVAAATDSQALGEALGSAVSGVLFWVLSANYYYKRRAEFT